jgi:signal transduction histidine kinase
MKMFACNNELTQLEAALPPLEGAVRLVLLVALASHLTQRDTPRALALASEAEMIASDARLPQHERQALAARLLLIRAEVKALYAHADSAILADAALRDFTQLDDAQGMADTHWLLGLIANDQGNTVRRDAQWESAAAVAQHAGDTMRFEIVQAALAFLTAFRDIAVAKARWERHFDPARTDWPPPLAVWANSYLGSAASLSSDFGAAATHYARAHEAAQETGQIRCAISAALNVGDAFTNLNDHHSALDWMHRGLDLARPTGWPGSIGLALTQTAETLRHLNQLTLAQDMLQEAIAALAPLPASRGYAIALTYMGNLALSQGDFAGAKGIFTQLQERADVLNYADFQTNARRGLAHALAKLGHSQEALACATLALRQAQTQGDVRNQIAALRVLAKIHSTSALPAPENMLALSAPLHYLLQALDITSGIDGYTIHGDLLDAVAVAYATVGKAQDAFGFARRANLARQKIYGQEAINHAIAMQVRQSAERDHAEAQYHRQLAASEAKRAEILQQASNSLVHLGAISQEITAHLDASAVFQVLSQHVHGLLNASACAIYLTDPDGLTLHRSFGMEHGKTLPAARYILADSNANAAQCMREQRELLINFSDSEPSLDALGSLSALYGPLTIDNRQLGVMAVQSMQRHAYGERERQIFRTLCAYSAIALDNAGAYNKLQDAQTKLVEQEKLAALGALVAGVAHELNTPIGNSLMMASSLQDNTRAMQSNIHLKNLRRSDLNNFLLETRESSGLIMRGLTSAADLINSFKQVAVDRTSAQHRRFNLLQTSREIAATMKNQLKHAGHTIELDMPDEIVLDSYPGPFGQVIGNLINNALLHAFDDRQHGHMILSARQLSAERVEIKFSDNGCGIEDHYLSRLFDPFFTTKLGQGGSGLGLNICYNIVTSLLNGSITVHSQLGNGAAFLLNLAISVPRQHLQAEPMVYV